MVLSAHVPFGHGVHDEGAYGAGLALAVPGVVQHHARVGVVPKEDRHQTRDQLVFQGVPVWLESNKVQRCIKTI